MRDTAKPLEMLSRRLSFSPSRTHREKRVNHPRRNTKNPRRGFLSRVILILKLLPLLLPRRHARNVPSFDQRPNE